MFDIEDLVTDPELENKGTWFPLGKGSKLLVARSGNKAYGKLLSTLYEQNQAVLDLGGDLAEAKSDEIMIDVMARTILLGWENFGRGGVQATYSTEKAREFLAIPDFRQMVLTFSRTQEAYRAKKERQQGEG